VVTPDSVVGPSYVTILGVGTNRYSPYWASGAAASPCLDMRSIGWRVEGIRFGGPVTEACIQLRNTAPAADDVSARTAIVGCMFDGLTVGRYGIMNQGAPNVWIVDNVFQGFHNAVGGGAIPLNTAVAPAAIPYRNHIVGNVFWDNDNGAVYSCNGSIVAENVFQSVGYVYGNTLVLQTSTIANPGDDNIVSGNHFGGTYTIAGGYRAGAADDWVGNVAEDVAGAGVADNGLTIARPA